MATIEVKLAARGARLMLNNESCKIIIEKASPSFVFITKPGIFKNDNGEDCIYVPKEQIIVPLTDITKIEVGNRFNPNIRSMMTIAW